jgi:hypothetical protein
MEVNFRTRLGLPFPRGYYVSDNVHRIHHGIVPANILLPNICEASTSITRSAIVVPSYAGTRSTYAAIQSSAHRAWSDPYQQSSPFSPIIPRQPFPSAGTHSCPFFQPRNRGDKVRRCPHPDRDRVYKAHMLTHHDFNLEGRPIDRDERRLRVAQMSNDPKTRSFELTNPHRLWAKDNHQAMLHDQCVPRASNQPESVSSKPSYASPLALKVRHRARIRKPVGTTHE